MPSVADARTLLAETLDVADAADDPADREAAVGSALEGLVAYARTLDVDPERAARAASRRFRGRTESALQTLEADGVDPATLDSSGWRQRLSDVSTPQDPGASGDEG
jgi:hypothetical protein